MHLDNRAGAFPLAARLYGTDPEQAVRFAFRPSALEVAPGQVGVADVRVSAPRPDGGETLTRPFMIVADDGRGAVEAAGSFVQSAGDRRPLWRVVLTVLGALLVAVGCFRDWLVGRSGRPAAGRVDDPGEHRADRPRRRCRAPPGGGRRCSGRSQPIERTLTLLLAGLMAVRARRAHGPADAGDRRGRGADDGRGRAVLALHGPFSLADGAFLVAVGGLVGLRRRPVRAAVNDEYPRRRAHPS